MPTYTNLKGVDDFGDFVPPQQLQYNLISFFDWAFLNKGGFYNTTIPQSGAYGGREDRLRVVEDKNFTKGRVWEAYRSNWIWESGLEYSLQPISISGVWVNSTFYPSSTSGTYAHYIDYTKGRVVFDTAISTGSLVQMNYSHKWTTFVDGEQPWFKEVVADSYRIESNFLAYGSGNHNILAQKRYQLPLVGIEMVENQKFTGLGLGGGHIYRQDFICNIVADNKSDRDKILYALSVQIDKRIHLYDFNEIANNNRFPIQANGRLNNAPLTYADLVNQFNWKTAYFLETDTVKPRTNNSSLYTGIVRITMEMDLPTA